MTFDAPHRQPTSIGGYFPDIYEAQRPTDIAVVIPTVLRPSLIRAVESVFAQTFTGRIQLMIGVDKGAGDMGALHGLLARRPTNVSAIVMTLPYSTSVRHGGVHGATDGGSIRSILSFMASARHVAYLDDDNAWEARHLALLARAIEGRAWAHSLRMLVDEATDQDICLDRWDSVGVGRGRFAADGGLVDPNCLMVDKVVCARALGRWSEGPGVTSDRSFFRAIKDAPHGRVEEPTVRYGVRPTNVMLQFMRDGVEF